MASLEERLLTHSKVFDQLLSLIPAKNYFSAGDSSTQWNKRKQTKVESQRAKKAKLDPDSVMSVADMRREQQRNPGVVEDGMERAVDGGDEEGLVEPTVVKRKKSKKEFTKEAKAVAGTGARKDGRTKSGNDRYAAPGDVGDAEIEAEDDGEAEEIELDGFNFSTHLTVSPSLPSKLNPADTSKPPPTISAEQRADQRSRLAARIEALRAKRRADSPDGTPARNRHELMAARRREEAVQRKERKREIRSHQKASSEQTKDVTPKGPIPKNETNSQSRVSGGENPQKDKYTGKTNPPTNHERGGKGGKEGMSKKSSSKKSRPGFEGSLKSSKGKR